MMAEITINDDVREMTHAAFVDGTLVRQTSDRGVVLRKLLKLERLLRDDFDSAALFDELAEYVDLDLETVTITIFDNALDTRVGEIQHQLTTHLVQLQRLFENSGRKSLFHTRQKMINHTNEERQLQQQILTEITVLHLAILYGAQVNQNLI